MANRKFLYVLMAVLALALAGMACSFGGGDEQPTSAPQATLAQIPSGINNPSVPFEAVVQIWAMYEDENGELQIGWTGSGTIISPDGLILTNAHVVLPDRYFPVDALVVAMTEVQDQEPDPIFYAEVLQADAALDIAVIRVSQDMDENAVSGLNLPFVPLGDSDSLNLGDNITILGYPGIGGDTVTLTRGEVSGFTSQPQYGQRAFIKTSATIAGGNSGGLALDNAGHLVGVPTQLGYGGDDQFVDCRVLADTNRDGFVDDLDSCVPTGGFINALRPVKLALPYIEAAQRGELSILGAEEPVVADQPVPVNEALSLTDGFSDESSGWDVFTADWGAAFYSTDEYFLQDVPDDSTTLGVFYSAYGDFADTEMSIEARTIETDGDNEISLLCRFVDNSNFYEFRYQEGFFSIGKFVNGEYTLLLDWLESPDVEIETEKATLSAACVGDQLSMAINGRQLGSATDDSFVSGKVGVATTNWETGNYTVAFDNFNLDVSPQGVQTSSNDQIFFDDFSNPNSGWTVESDTEVSSSYENGQYLMSVFPDNYWYWKVSGNEFSNVIINVDVEATRSGGDGDFGIICRYVDADNFYALEVSEDGYYSIWKMVDGESVSLVDWQASSLIPVDGSSYTVNASCDGAQLLLGVNAELVAEATDGDYSSGDVGMIVGTWTQANNTIAFDNFEVLEP